MKDTLTAKEIWDNLKSKYTTDGWYFKSQILNRLQEASYTFSKNISDSGLTIKTLLEKLNNAAITIQDHITFIIINFLGPNFETYVIVLNKKTRNGKVLANVDTILKNLKKDEIRMAGKSLLNNIKTGFSGRSSWSGQNARDCVGQGGHSGWGGRDSQGEQDSRDGAKNGSSKANYSDAWFHSFKKKWHIANFCTKPAPIPKDDNKSGKPPGTMTVDEVTLCQVRNLKKLDLLDYDETSHTYNSQDAFTNFRPMEKRPVQLQKNWLFLIVEKTLWKSSLILTLCSPKFFIFRP